ncbi:nuclear transport factor 2 family protein [Roseobacter sinensis]|uniref:Nuclear transport factor 2 family protein n=1 Tax=Roseobacter sinensis TaxID=2931391 RepID=A0ABT3B8P0_9RHOB|nr:nuclear transport factor 2 family protein [Roseobacter sp. WL0113]MCV3269938.1 nuclear transport factor 2 family protein [Roseobacter sp. WL0113]
MTLPAEIRRYLAAYNRRDVPGMLRLVSHDVRFQNLVDGAVTAEARGLEAFRSLAETGARAFARRCQVVEQAMTVSDTTLAEITFTAVVAVDLPNGWRAGQQVRIAGRSLFQIRLGTLIRIVDQSESGSDNR